MTSATPMAEAAPVVARLHRREGLGPYIESLDASWQVGAGLFNLHAVKVAEADGTPVEATPAPSTPVAEGIVAWPGRKFCETAERNALELAQWIKGADDKEVANDAALAIKSLLASIDTLAADRDSWRKKAGQLHDYANMRDTQIYDLTQALEPFTEVVDLYDPSEEGDNTSATLVCGSVTDYTLTLGDFRLASKVLASLKGDPTP